MQGAHWSQVVEPTHDGKEFDEQDAQLTLNMGTPRSVLALGMLLRINYFTALYWRACVPDASPGLCLPGVVVELLALHRSLSHPTIHAVVSDLQGAGSLSGITA
jgi:hypothetical protein